MSGALKKKQGLTITSEKTDNGRRVYRIALLYNNIRTHLSLAKDAPLVRPVQRFGFIAATPILGGHHHEYCRI